MTLFIIRCASPEQFLQLKEEFSAAIKAENEKRNVLSLDLSGSQYDELKKRGIEIRAERQFSPDVV